MDEDFVFRQQINSKLRFELIQINKNNIEIFRETIDKQYQFSYTRRKTGFVRMYKVN